MTEFSTMYESTFVGRSHLLAMKNQLLDLRSSNTQMTVIPQILLFTKAYKLLFFGGLEMYSFAYALIFVE